MQTLAKFEKFVEEINRENGRLYKESILKKHKDDEDIKYFLNFVFNPYIVTGVSDKKLNRLDDLNLWINNENIDYCFNSAKEALEYVKVNNTGRNEDIDKLRSFYMMCQAFDIKGSFDGYTSSIHKTFVRLLKKDFSLGVDTKTINKIIPGLIPEFNVMLANKYFDNPKAIAGKEFALTTKIDGGRIIAIKENGNVTFYTRQGQPYEGLVDLEQEMKEYMPDNICLDGEITVLEKGDMTSKEQYKETMKITRAKGEKHGIKMLVFDCMPSEQFRHQKCNASYKARRAHLDDIFSNYNFKYFNLLPIIYTGSDVNEIDKWLHYNVEHGEEGLMINVLDAPYEFKRTSNLLKVKLFNDVDLEVIGFEEGTGKYAGNLGAIIVNYKGNTLGVGSGFSDELRKEIWANKESWLGRTIVVKYFEETQNSDGKLSLRFPVYLDYRTDK